MQGPLYQCLSLAFIQLVLYAGSITWKVHLRDLYNVVFTVKLSLQVVCRVVWTILVYSMKF